MTVGFKFRAYPTPEQQTLLLQWIGCQRMIYNCKVAEDRYFHSLQRKALSLVGQYPPIDQTYSQFKDKTLTPWLYEIPSQVLRNGAVKWLQAYSRFFKKLSGRPVFQSKSGKQSVWLTNELFHFQPVTDSLTGKVSHYSLWVGTVKHKIGQIVFKAHREFVPPKSIHVSVEAGYWFISFCNEPLIEQFQPTQAEIQAELAQWTEKDLSEATLGIDRGIAIPIAVSNGQTFDFLPQQKARVAKQEQYRKRWQRKLARRVKGSKNYHKAQKRIAQSYQYAKQVRLNFNHQVSHQLVSQPKVRLIVFEDLNVKGMTKAPLPKPDPAREGVYLPNGSRAKAGLNKSILSIGWSQLLAFTQYKAVKHNQLCVTVPPHFTSQECSECGHIHFDNRLTQSRFVCQACAFTLNADHNAGRVIAKKGIHQVKTDSVKKKESKTTMRLSKKHQKESSVGMECSELPPKGENAHGEEHFHSAMLNEKQVFSLK